jgi:hypothetical protein
MDVGFLGLGFQPKWGVADTPVMPKGRYEIMRKYMPTVGSMGLDMMFRTTTIQVRTIWREPAAIPSVRFPYQSGAKRVALGARICKERTTDGAMVVISPQPSPHHLLIITHGAKSCVPRFACWCEIRHVFFTGRANVPRWRNAVSCVALNRSRRFSCLSVRGP